MNAVADISKLIIAWYQESPRDLVPLEVWADKNKCSPSTVRGWISKKVITEGEHCYKDPNGHWWISIEAMERWVKSRYSANDTPVIRPNKQGRKPKASRRGNAPELK